MHLYADRDNDDDDNNNDIGVCLPSPSVVSDSLATPPTIAHQPPLSLGFPRQESWNGSPFPSPGHLLGPGIEPVSFALAGGFFTIEPPGKPGWGSRLFIKARSVEFPVVPVIRALCLHCQGPGFQPWSWETKTLQASWHGQRKKKKSCSSQRQ